jgi:hypothetical protein
VSIEQNQPIENKTPRQEIIYAPYEFWAVECRPYHLPIIQLIDAENEEDAKRLAEKWTITNGEKNRYAAVKVRIVAREEVSL